MGRPKALLSYQGRTFLEKLVSDYQQIGCQPIVVVLGRTAEHIRSVLDESEVSVRINTRPEDGPLSSIQIGLQTLPSDCSGFFVCPSDHPVVHVETLRSMIETWDHCASYAVKPRYGNRGGHPVLLGRAWREAVLDLPLTSSLRELMRTRSSAVITMDVPDPGILMNVDTPEDYERLNSD